MFLDPDPRHWINFYIVRYPLYLPQPRAVEVGCSYPHVPPGLLRKKLVDIA